MFVSVSKNLQQEKMVPKCPGLLATDALSSISSASFRLAVATRSLFHQNDWRKPVWFFFSPSDGGNADNKCSIRHEHLQKEYVKKKKFRHPSYKLKRCDKWFFIFFPPILGFPNPQLCKSSNADDRMKTSCCCELESTKMQIFKNKYTANCSEKSVVSWRIHSGCIDKIWVFFFFFGFLIWIDDTDNYVCECNHNIDPTCVDRNDSVNAFSQIFLLPSLLRVLQRIPILVFTLRTCHQLLNRHTETNDPHCSPTDRPTGWSV